MKNKEKPNKPVSIHYDEQGNPDGIRVCALDEDFILALRDEPCGSVNYSKAKKYSLPTRKMVNLYSYYIHEIQAAMVEAGGEKLCGWYWTSTSADELFGAVNADLQLLFSGGGGTLGYNLRIYSVQVRVALALK